MGYGSCLVGVIQTCNLYTVKNTHTGELHNNRISLIFLIIAGSCRVPLGCCGIPSFLVIYICCFETVTYWCLYIIRMWCSDGIVTTHVGDGRIRCVVSHFTSFAVLVSPGGVHGGVPLKVVSYIGCVVSIVCLTLSLIHI